MGDKEQKKSCGYCEGYVPMVSELRGICRFLPGEKPGQRGKKVTYDMDATPCDKFQPLAEVARIDIAQGAMGARYTGGRASTVFDVTTDDTKADRLVWEKHSKEHK